MTRMVQRRLMLLVLVAVILVGGVSTASADLRDIVMFVDGTPSAVQQQLVALSGSTVLYDLSPLITALAILTTDQGLAFLESKVQGVCNPLLDPLCVVTSVSHDVLTFIDPICPTTAPPSVPESYRWGPQQIEVPAVDQEWPKVKGSAAVTVAVLDTGIAFHQELSGRITPGYNAITGGPPADGHGHGTHMAGIITAAKNAQAMIGVAGVEPSIEVAAVKVLDDSGAGYLSSVIDGMRWVFENDIPLVNMSFGFSFSNPSDSTPLTKAVQKLYEAGVIMVASAGNRCPASTASDDGGGDDCGPAATCDAPLTAVTYPAAYGGWVIAVGATTYGATTKDQRVASYSLSGSQLAVVAPGGQLASGAPDYGEILSTNIGGTYGLGRGTSQAAAHVTGAVALALQIQPGLTPDGVRNLVTQTAVKLPSYSPSQQGAGQIDVKNMIEELVP